MAGVEGWPGIDARTTPTGDGASLVSNASYGVIGMLVPRAGMEQAASISIVARAMAPFRTVAFRSLVTVGGNTARSDRP
jgi:hypothetical protein